MSAAAINWEMTVAHAAPAMPVSGKQAQPKIRNGSIKAFITKEIIRITIGVLVSPILCKILCRTSKRKIKIRPL